MGGQLGEAVVDTAAPVAGRAWPAEVHGRSGPRLRRRLCSPLVHSGFGRGVVRTAPEAGSSTRVDPLGDTAWCGRSGQGGCPSLAMVVTRLSLELCFQGGRLRGVRCKLARWPRGAPPEPAASIVGQVLVPVLLSGLGVVAAGLLMNRVQVRTGGARRQTPQDRPRARRGDQAWGRARGSSWGCGHLRSRVPDALAQSACRDSQPGNWKFK